MMTDPSLNEGGGDFFINAVTDSDTASMQAAWAQGKALDSPVTSVQSQNDVLPQQFALHANYPNPFNPSTTIVFDLPESADVTLAVFNALQLEMIEWLNRVSTLLLGILVVLASKLPKQAFNVLVVLVGLCHGYANGLLELEGQDLALYVAGVLFAAYVLVTLTAAASQWLVQGQRWGIIAIRALGSWVTAIGVLYFGYSMLAPATA